MDDAEKLSKGQVYATIDQRLQGDENFVERVLQQYDGPLEGRKRKKEQTLPAISAAIESLHGVSLDEMRRATKHQNVSRARKAFAHAAREYGYRGKEIADYLEKTPASVTMYLRPEGEVNNMAADVLKYLRSAKNINNEA
jgi:predicted transcriptional regulator